VIAIRPSPILAHVVSYLLFRGDLEPGEQVHHRCENRACCRPDHLEAKPRSLHIAEHNRSKRKAKANWSNSIIEVKEEVLDGRTTRSTYFAASSRAGLVERATRRRCPFEVVARSP
jgi:hypothetical protein